MDERAVGRQGLRPKRQLSASADRRRPPLHPVADPEVNEVALVPLGHGVSTGDKVSISSKKDARERSGRSGCRKCVGHLSGALREVEMVSKFVDARCRLAALTCIVVGSHAAPALAQSDWKPNRPIEFIGAARPGGGTDIFARAVQLAIQNHKLIDQPILVSNKGGGSGAETFVYVKAAAGDGHKLAFGTSNLYTLPMVAKVAFKHADFMPVAAMVFDEFVLWTKGDAPYTDYKSFTQAAKDANGTFKMAGALSKDTDQTLTRLIEKDTGAKFIYIPYRSGSEASVQL